MRGYVSCVAGCPYEGAVSIAKTNEVTSKLIDIGCYEVSLGDTIGIGTPQQIIELLDGIKVDNKKLAGHFHNTYGRAIANIIVSMSKGVTTFDSSVAGLGGCPYAVGASGNVATEDLLFLCSVLGIETNIDKRKLFKEGARMQTLLAIEKRSGVVIDDIINEEELTNYRTLLI